MESETDMEVVSEKSVNTNGEPESVTIAVEVNDERAFSELDRYEIVFERVTDVPQFEFREYKSHTGPVNRDTLGALGVALDYMAKHYGPVVEDDQVL